MVYVNPEAEEATVTFDGLAVLTPRGRYSVELHLSFLHLESCFDDFKIQYSSVVQLFTLPKSNQPHTFVIISLDPPIYKGRTLHSHIVIQFENERIFNGPLSISDDLLNTKYKDKLQKTYTGLIHEVFTKVLQGLSGARVTKPGRFRSAQDAFAVKSSLKAEDGVLYPLEKSFFFLPNSPTLICHDEIDYVEFKGRAGGGSNTRYFDLLIRLKTGQEHLFWNIQMNECHNLFDFISSKDLKIINPGGAGTTDCVAADVDGDEIDEEDEDFVADKDDEGSPTDDSDEEQSDASDSGGQKEESSEKESKNEASSSKGLPPKKKPRDGDEDSAEKKKQKKKDPDAPKRTISAQDCNLMATIDKNNEEIKQMKEELAEMQKLKEEVAEMRRFMHQFRGSLPAPSGSEGN